MQRTLEVLGLDAEALNDKCSQYSTLFVKDLITDQSDRKVMTEWVRDNFTREEMIYMSTYWLNEKTAQCYVEYINEGKSQQNDTRSL